MNDAEYSFYLLVKRTIGDRYIKREELFMPEDWIPEPDPPAVWQESQERVDKPKVRALLDRWDREQLWIGTPIGKPLGFEVKEDFWGDGESGDLQAGQGDWQIVGDSGNEAGHNGGWGRDS